MEKKSKKGKTLVNKVTGEKITWIETSEDTQGKHILFDFEIAPNTRVPVRHIHPTQEEHFSIESGVLRVEVEGKTQLVKAGETVVVPAGKAHQWWNDSLEEAVKCKVKFVPALQTEIFFEQLFGLANEGKTKGDGSPKFMQIMTMSNRYDAYISGPPIPVQKTMSFILGNVAKCLGYKAYHKKYSEY